MEGGMRERERTCPRGRSSVFDCRTPAALLLVRGEEGSNGYGALDERDSRVSIQDQKKGVWWREQWRGRASTAFNYIFKLEYFFHHLCAHSVSM
jgi:hypothetical protein